MAKESSNNLIPKAQGRHTTRMEHTCKGLQRRHRLNKCNMHAQPITTAANHPMQASTTNEGIAHVYTTPSFESWRGLYTQRFASVLLPSASVTWVKLLGLSAPFRTILDKCYGKPHLVTFCLVTKTPSRFVFASVLLLFCFRFASITQATL